MNMTPLFTVVLTALANSWGFNLEPRHSEIINDPRNETNSYFGYALGLQRQSYQGRNTTWLFVGAPQGNQEGFKGDGKKPTGAVYECRLDTLQSPPCRTVPILRKGDVKRIYFGKKIGKILTTRSWMGATIAVENKLNGAVVVCAPRMKLEGSITSRVIPGLCYWRNGNKTTSLDFFASKYVFRENQNDTGFEVGLTLSGLSAHFVQNSTTIQLLVGAPGLNSFQGGVGVYKTSGVKGLPSLHLPTAPDHRNDAYLGYSVTSFRLNNEGRVSYVAGAPVYDGDELKSGAVYVLNHKNESCWETTTLLKGQQMGEYFGACLAAVDLDFDGKDDLLVVGAPFYSHEGSTDESLGGDQGRIWVFRRDGENLKDRNPDNIMGTMTSGARFGSAVAVIGDLNGDGLGDIAVGAPYEGSGAIYVYHGKDIYTLSSQYSQKIFGSEIKPYLSGFGISIASGLDVDDNSFNDLAVGSFGSSTTVVIKSYPVVTIKGHLIPNVTQLNTKPWNFSVAACLNYSSSAKAEHLQNITVNMTVTVDSTSKRAVLVAQGFLENQTLHHQTTIRRDNMYCWHLIVKLQENLHQVFKPIELSMAFNVSEDPSLHKEFCKMCPMTDPHRPNLVQIKVPFANGCKQEGVCWADLKVEVNTSTDGKPLVLGREKTISLNVTITNSGEPAYLAKLTLTLPKKNLLQKTPKNCYEDQPNEQARAQQQEVKCNLGDIEPTRESSSPIIPRKTDFVLEVGSLPLETSHLTFNVSVFSTSQERTLADNNFTIHVPVRLVSEVDIVGNTLHNNKILSSKHQNEPTTFGAAHKYEIFNEGPSPVGAVHTTFFVPTGLTKVSGSGLEVFSSLVNPQVVLESYTYPCYLDETALTSPIFNYMVSILMDQDRNDSNAVETPTFHGTDEGLTDLIRRGLEMTEEGNDTQSKRLHEKRILYLNCSGEGVVCVAVSCEVGPLTVDSKMDVDLQLLLNTTALESFLLDVNLIKLASIGIVDIVGYKNYNVPSGKRYHSAIVHTNIMGEVAGEKVAPWLLPLSIAIGLFVLLLLIKALSNVGFFKRGTKEKLEQLKEQAAVEDFEVLEYTKVRNKSLMEVPSS